MQNNPRYGVIGCGMMGREHLRNIALVPGGEVVAIFEPDGEMRDRAAQIAPNAEMVASIEALLALPEVNCLLIASPNDMHMSQLETIARMRPLPVLVEKPLVVSKDEIGHLAILRRDYPAPLWVAMEYRYMPPVARLIEEADAATGGICMLTLREHRFPFLTKVGNWNRTNRRTGGTLVEKCCHFFDLMRHILKSDPVRVMASGSQAVNHKGETYEGAPADIWDNAYVIVDFASGARAMLELCMFAEGSRYQEEICAIGPAGKIECHVPGPARFWPEHLGEPPVAQVIVSPRASKGPRVVTIPVDPQLLEAGDHNGSTFYQHMRFARAIAGTGPVEVTAEDGLWAVAMGLAAQQSAITGKAVSLDGPAFGKE
ncbi:Gfo/Idh/MocA family protein [Aliihoeflea sp. PC F10.4]